MPKQTIDGVEYDVPDQIAAHLTAQAERLKAIESESKATAEALGKAKAEADTRARAEAEAVRKAEQDGLIKKGEFEKLLEIREKEKADLLSEFKHERLRGSILAHPRFRRTGLDEKQQERAANVILRELADTVTYDTATKTISAKGHASVSTAIEALLADLPQFAEPAAHTGTGADPTKTRTVAPGTKRSAMTVEQKCDFIDKHGQAAFHALPA
jgi:hypothetical protein